MTKIEPYPWARSWVVLDYWDGSGTRKVILRPEHVAAVAVESHPYAYGDFLVAVSTTRGAYLVPPLPNESEGDALARVCALLGIEVTR